MFPGGLTLPRLKSLFSKDLQPALECGPRKPLLWYAPFSPLTEQSSKLPFVFTFGCFHMTGSAGLTNQPTNQPMYQPWRMLSAALSMPLGSYVVHSREFCCPPLS